MKFVQRLTNERFAKPAAHFMQGACYVVICFYALCLALSLMGRQTFFLHTHTGTYERAIYAEENHDSHSRTMTVQMGDDIHVWTNGNDRIDWKVHMGLSLMYAFHTVPMIFAYWFLSRVFANIRQGRIFTDQNSSFLLYYGLLQFSEAVFLPFIKLLVCWIVSFDPESRMSISTGQTMLTTLVPSTAFIVAAYIIHYGVHLQDEVDHTL